MSQFVTVWLLGENPVSLDGLGRILSENNFVVMGSGSDPAALDERAAHDSAAPQLILVDSLIEAKGVSILADIHARAPQGQIIVLTDRFEYEMMMECFRLDARAYIVKKISASSLVAYLNLVAVGEKVMPSDLTSILLARMPSGHSAAHTDTIAAAGLSPREEQILAGLVAGQPNKVISRHFMISEATVKVHVKAILRKIGVQNRTQAAIWAMGERDDASFTPVSTCRTSQAGNGHFSEK